MPGFASCNDAPKVCARPQEVSFDFSALPVRASSNALCDLEGHGTCSMHAASAALATAQGHVPLREAIWNEIHRAEVARKILEDIIRVIHENIVEPASATSKKKCNSAGQIANGLFPALVFEYLAQREGGVGGNVHDPPMDPIIPSSKSFPDGVALSVVKRITPFVHDLLRYKGDALSTKSAQITKVIVALLTPRSVPLAPTEEHVINVSKDELGQVTLSIGAYRHTLLQSHYDKLSRLYIGAADELDSRIFLLCQRYFVLTGSTENPSQESGWHGSVPPNVMTLLASRNDFGGECFASPFNASCSSFYSAFPDVDCYFGSVGSFFSGPAPRRGLFEANPPFEHSTVIAMALRMKKLLSNSCEPLAFLVVLPWADKGKALSSLNGFRSIVEVDTILGGYVDLDGSRTPFVDGYQQSSIHSAFTSRLDTRLLVLQNRAHAASNTSESLKRLLDDISNEWRVPGWKRPRSQGS